MSPEKLSSIELQQRYFETLSEAQQAVAKCAFAYNAIEAPTNDKSDSAISQPKSQNESTSQKDTD